MLCLIRTGPRSAVPYLLLPAFFTASVSTSCFLSNYLSIIYCLSAQPVHPLSINLSSASLSIDLFKVYLSLYLSIYSAIHLSSPPAISILLSICLCIYRSILIIYPVYPYLLLSLSLYISLHLSTMSIPLAIYLPFYVAKCQEMTGRHPEGCVPHPELRSVGALACGSAGAVEIRCQS